MKTANTKKSKFFIAIMAVILAISMMSSSFISVNAEKSYSNLTELAKEYIIITQGGDELAPICTYTGIQDFIKKAHDFFPYIDDISLARFIYEYTGHDNSNNLPDAVILEVLEYIEVTVQEEHLMTTKDGETIGVTEQQALKGSSSVSADNIISIGNGSIVSPNSTSNTWTSQNGYMKIKTSYAYVKTSKDNKYYTISALASWLKEPSFKYSDIICISNNASYDSSYNDYAYYKQSFSCLSNDLTSHLGKQITCEIDINGNYSDSGIEFSYQSNNGASALVDLKTFSCGKPGMDAHIKKMNYMEAYIRYRIICKADTAYNIQGGYCHSRGGLSDPTVDFDGLNIEFSLVGLKDEYKTRPITINA